MESLAGIVQKNSAKAKQASDRAQDISAAARRGEDAMTRANHAMSEIRDSAARIFSIVDMIDDIAFQTNLLALNASVEAARAGEAGKGFAVVAVEVRRLAQSAAAASSDVKQLIESSTLRIADGGKLVAQAADELSSMLGSLHQNTQLIGEISEVGQDQAVSIESRCWKRCDGSTR